MTIKPHYFFNTDDPKFLPRLLNEIFDQSLKKITALISVNNVNIVFYSGKYGVIKEIGFGGQTITKNFILIPIDTQFKDLKSSLKLNLPKTLAHELYHCLRGYTYKERTNLLEALVNEGLADHFDIEINGGGPRPWDLAFKNNQFNYFFKKAKKEFFKTNYNHQDWFFGSKKRNIPRWTGYTLGFKIIENYLNKHPKEKVSTIYQKKTEEFLSETGF